MTRVGRNDPCPCGSGRKFKACHGRRGSGLIGRPVMMPMWVIVATVVVVVGGALGLLYRSTSRNGAAPGTMALPPGAALPSPGTTSAAGPDPAPWTYDPQTNRHWDPSHRHWHNGRPPANPSAAATTPPLTVGTGAPATAPTATAPTPEPSPWTYNETTKQYWDPRHHHWHGGQPPPPETRAALMAEFNRGRDTAGTRAVTGTPGTP